jgi:hypothetical protein
MPVALASELWSEIKRYISTVDREEAAETMVNVLIDNDVEAEEIKSAFKGDLDIKRALGQYLKDNEEDVEEDYYENDDDNEDH